MLTYVFLQISNYKATRFVAVTLIVLSTIYAVPISDKVKFTEAATGGVLHKMLLLNILQYSQENTSVGVSFNKVTTPQHCNFIKKRLQHRCFPVNITKFFKSTYFEEHLRTAASKFNTRASISNESKLYFT